MTKSIYGGFSDMVLIKYSSSGDQLWNRTWNNPGHPSVGEAVIVDSTNNIYVIVGLGILLKYNSSGSKLWERWESAGWRYRCITIDISDDIYIAGSASGGWDILVVKYNSTGDIQWHYIWGTSNNLESRGITLDTNNSIFVAGSRHIYNPPNSTNDFLLIKLSSIPAAPDSPYNPNPPDGSNEIGLDITLSVDVSHPSGVLMNVSFYNAFNDNLIGVDIGVFSGETASVSWSGLSEGTTYQWYVIVSDDIDITISSTWIFTTLDIPSWVQIPSDQIIEYGDPFNYDINAIDNSGIDYYWINDTIYFNIDENGVITNNTILNVGIYWLEVRAYDPLGQYCTAIFKIDVQAINIPEPEPEPEPEPDGDSNGELIGIDLIPLIAIISLATIIPLIIITKRKK